MAGNDNLPGIVFQGSTFNEIKVTGFETPIGASAEKGTVVTEQGGNHPVLAVEKNILISQRSIQALATAWQKSNSNPATYTSMGLEPSALALQPEGGIIQWGNNSSLNDDQGGSLELGGNSTTKGAGTPYIDFHYKDLLEDFNTRIINDAGGRLSIIAPVLFASGSLGIGTGVPASMLHLDVPASGKPISAMTIDVQSFGDNAPGSHFFRARDLSMGAAANTTSFIIRGDGNVGIGIDNPSVKLEVNGDIQVWGDVKLAGGDCAEEFDISGAASVEPGMVMVINDEGKLCPGETAYDKRVAGVISGAGDLRPGIMLDRKSEDPDRLPVALSGKVYCKVDARYGPVEVGDLLTTSPTRGHAMKVIDHGRALGTVIGKALRGLTDGQGLIPILVALQ